MAILVFEHTDSSGIDRLGTALRHAGHRLRFIRPDLGQPVAIDLDDIDGVVSCGGPQSAYDDAIAWLADEMQIIREAHERSIPVVGLCLGCQLAARALGGNVERNPAGLEFGWHEIRLTPVGREDAILAGLGWTHMQFHHHRDHVSTLPPGARLLAGSSKCKVQAWSLGLRTYGFQFHPEVSMPTIEGWMHREPDLLNEAGLSTERLRMDNQARFPTFERITERLFESLALLLMPVDRRQSGLVKDLHY